MMDYPALRAVAAVVQSGSFERAAAMLGVTPSAISQRVKHLEERLGTVLIERGQPCIATEKGAWLCRHMDRVGMLEQELMQQLPELAAPAQRVTLAIAANSDSVGTWFLDAVAEFTRTSDYLMNIAIDDEENTADWLRRGRVFAAVTSVEKPVQGCRVTPLGSLRYHATASPEYMRRHFPDGVTVAALTQAPSLTFDHKDDLQRLWIKRNFGHDLAHPTHWLPSTQSFVDACVAGIGWAMNPAQLARDHLAAGRLVELLPGATFDRPLYWQVSRLAADRLAGLTRAVLATARRELV
ncbi:LysR family transcriptional regulator ArgP [Paracoccus litorisediminis]|uniref:LysR family transcriptional regulator ArgP n=1 Tax=Paracoccus litorisediminis TaxID=2006130 RepID=UPI00373058AC